MKKRNVKTVIFMPVLLLAFAGCSDMYTQIEDLRSEERGAVSSLFSGYDAMVFVPGKSVTASAGNGVFKDASGGAPVTVESFYIGEYEVTYGLWHDVYKWATEDLNGDGRRDSDGGQLYVFLNVGRAGSDGIKKDGDELVGSDGGTPDSVSARQPVTKVSWQDVVVWCNAYSEKTGKTPVYGSQGHAGGFVFDAGHAGNAIRNENADGYRLPTRQEWEFAARGGDPDGAGWLYAYAGSDDIASVAWYIGNCTGVTQLAGLKKANGLGLYDMSGNAGELCEDGEDLSETAVAGGVSYREAGDCTVDSAAAIRRNAPDTGYGFRLACSAISP